jgi:hypothetical protein
MKFFSNCIQTVSLVIRKKNYQLYISHVTLHGDRFPTNPSPMLIFFIVSWQKKPKISAYYTFRKFRPKNIYSRHKLLAFSRFSDYTNDDLNGEVVSNADC